MIDKWEAAKEEHKQGDSHKESSNVCGLKLHDTVLVDIFSVNLEKICIEKYTCESYVPHYSNYYVSYSNQAIPYIHVSFIVSLNFIVLDYWNTTCMKEVANS